MAVLPNLRDFRSVLIVKPSSLGDIVHTLPAVAVLRQRWPHLRVRWVANPEWLPLLNGSDCVDEAIEFPRRELRGPAAPLRWWRWMRQFQKLPSDTPELVLDFQGLLRSGLISKASGSGPVLGLSNAREGATLFYDHIIGVDPSAHAVDRYLCLPTALGATLPERGLPWPLPLGEEPETALPERFILLHPWSRGEGKSLPTDALDAILQALAPVPVVLVGISSTPVVAMPAHVVDLSNRTSLAQLIWLMRRAAWNISVDSGPMHIAAAVNDRTLGIHTWSDPRKVGPYNPAALVWKGGIVAHRYEFSAEECQRESAFTKADVECLLEHVKDF